MSVPGGLDAVDPRYRLLYEQALSVLNGDPRVRSVELAGSIAAGTADKWSDLDLHVVALVEDHDAFLGDWPSWLAAITPTVFARTPIAPFILNTVTADGLAFDVAVFAGAEPEPATGSTYVVGSLSRRGFGTVGEALEYAVAEQLRGLAGPFISLIKREEHLRHLAGVPHLLGLLTTVFLAETGAAPPGKHWNRTFTEEQRAAVAALPPARATRDDIMAFGLGLANLLITRARPLYPRFDLTWPSDLASVAATRLHDCLGVDAQGWLH